MCTEDNIPSSSSPGLADVGGRQLELCLTARAAAAAVEEDDSDEPFEVIYSLDLKPEEGRTIFFSR